MAQAKIINMFSGGVVIAPWDVGQLDEEWLDVFLGLNDLPNLKETFQKFESLLAKRRSENPSYRKYLN